MNTFSYLLDGMDEFDAVCEHIKGVSGSQKSHLIYALGEHKAGQCLIVEPDETKAGRTVKDLSFLFGDDVLYFPPRDLLFYDVDVSNRKGEMRRLKALSAVRNSKYIVTTISALITYTAPSDVFASETLVYMGYSKVSAVEAKGQFSVRGSIADVFPPSADTPYRIEFWGDEVDSVRAFNPESQLS